jgi:hypothetical protein
LDAVTYPQPEVASYIIENFIPLRVRLDLREDWPFFRAHGILWTPTIVFMDRNGAPHYRSPGFLPPEDFVDMLRIGKAHCLMPWTRSREAALELEEVVARGGSFTPEALYWLGVARYLERRDTSGMWLAWERLTAEFPGTAWAKRVYPRGDERRNTNDES